MNELKITCSDNPASVDIVFPLTEKRPAGKIIKNAKILNDNKIQII